MSYALVTGGSRGIGGGFARALAARKRGLVLAGRSREALEEAAAELRSAHGTAVETVPCDLSESQAPAELIAEIERRGLPVGLLVNNAGFGERGEFQHLPLDSQRRMISLNVQALVELTHRLLPALKRNGPGGVINVSSLGGFQPLPYAAVYAATKAFVTSFSMALAAEVRSEGVAVVTLCPGRTETKPEAGPQKKGKFSSPPVEEVVEQALRKLERGGGLVLPGTTNKLSLFFQRLAPRSAVVKAAAYFAKPR